MYSNYVYPMYDSMPSARFSSSSMRPSVMSSSSSIPTSSMSSSSIPASSMSSSSIPVSSMPNYNMNNSTAQYSQNDERFIFPFLLGGVTGAALAPAFWRPNGYNPGYGRPCCGPYPPYYPYYR